MSIRLPHLLFFILAMPICASDLICGRIPDTFSLGGSGLILCLRSIVCPETLGETLTTGAALAGLLYAVWYFAGGLGRGDAKLALLLVLGLGTRWWLGAMLLAVLLAGLAAGPCARLFAGILPGIAVVRSARAGLPFAPFVVSGAALACVVIPEAG